MNNDPALRVLLGLILLCLLVLIAQGFGLGSSAEGPYRVSVIKSKTPWLMRFNTVTGQVEQYQMRGERHWVTLGEREPEVAGMEGRDEELETPGAAAEPAARAPRPRRAASPAPEAPAGPGDELAALVQAVQPDNPREIRAWAAGLLGNYVGEAPDTAVPALIRALGDPDSAVVAAAARSLGRSRQPEALQALKKLESHPDAAVKAAAREAGSGHP